MGGDVDPLVIDVRGERAPQGSKVALGRTKKGKTILKESSDKLPDWRHDVKVAAEKSMADAGWERPLAGPVVVMMAFYFYRPKNQYRTGKFSHLLRDDAPVRPIGSANDLDKLVRAVFDALTGAGVWYDDGQAVQQVADKCYTSPAREFHGALITVAPYQE
jgi:Holliday junction resolvase RusA-like endonuclease